MLKTNFFITATDTDAGKTFVCCGLVRAMLRQKCAVQVLKPIACGHEEGRLNADVAALLAAQNLIHGQAEQINLYNFNAPLAPWQAALLEGKSIDPNTLIRWCTAQCEPYAMNLIEAVGGLMVPLGEHFSVTDWLLALQPIQVMLVVRVKLGGINHMLLSLEKLKQLQCLPICIILNDADNCGQAMLNYHQQALHAYDATLTHVSFTHGATDNDFDQLYHQMVHTGFL